MINKKISKSLYVVFKIFLYAVILFIMLYPLWWLFTSSIKSSNEIIRTPPTFFIHDPTLAHLRIIFAKIEILGGFFFNSLYVSITIPIVQTAVCLLAAYAFAKLNFIGKNVIFLLFIGSMMIPPQLTMITNFITISKEFKLLNNLLSLQLLGTFSALAIFMFRQFFMTIPKDLEDAAKIDGCGTLNLFWRIAVPLAKPIIFVNFILCFNGVWGDFFNAMIFLRKTEVMTLPVGLTVIQGAYNTQSLGVTVASLALSTVPVIIIYFIFRKQLISGIATSGIKM